MPADRTAQALIDQLRAAADDLHHFEMTARREALLQVERDCERRRFERDRLVAQAKLLMGDSDGGHKQHGLTAALIKEAGRIPNHAVYQSILRTWSSEVSADSIDWTRDMSRYATPFRGRMYQSNYFATIYLTLTHCYQWSGTLTIEYDANGARKGSPRLRDRLEWRNAFPSDNPKPSADARLTPEEVAAFWDEALPDVPDVRRGEIAVDLEEWAFTVASGDWEGFR